MGKPLRNQPQVIQLLSPLIEFGRFCGIIPLKKVDREPYFELCQGSLCCNVVSFLLYFFTLIVSLLLLVESAFVNTSSSSGTISFVFTASQYVTYYIHCEVTLIFFITHHDDFIRLLQKWINLEMYLNRYKLRLSSSVKIQCWIIYIATVTLFSLEIVFFILRKVNCSLEKIWIPSELIFFFCNVMSSLWKRITISPIGIRLLMAYLKNQHTLITVLENTKSFMASR